MICCAFTKSKASSLLFYSLTILSIVVLVWNTYDLSTQPVPRLKNRLLNGTHLFLFLIYVAEIIAKGLLLCEGCFFGDLWKTVDFFYILSYLLSMIVNLPILKYNSILRNFGLPLSC